MVVTMFLLTGGQVAAGSFVVQYLLLLSDRKGSASLSADELGLAGSDMH